MNRFCYVHNMQFIKRVSENAGPYALYFRAFVPLRFQLSDSVPMLNCILCIKKIIIEDFCQHKSMK